MYAHMFLCIYTISLYDYMVYGIICISIYIHTHTPYYTHAHIHMHIYIRQYPSKVYTYNIYIHY